MTDLLNDLNAIGFTEYEAKVYLALLKEHPSTGYQISKMAGIPRSMVYEALGRLDVPPNAAGCSTGSPVHRAPAAAGHAAPGHERDL
jgi:hypothetical protein